MKRYHDNSNFYKGKHYKGQENFYKGRHIRVYGPTAAGVCVDVCGLNYHQRSGRGLWSVLLPEAVSRSLGCAASGDMLIWVACAATKDHVWIHGPTEARLCVSLHSLYYRQRSCELLWSVL